MTGSANVIEGVIVPLLTPVDENEIVDESTLRALIGHCIQGGVNGIFAGAAAANILSGMLAWFWFNSLCRRYVTTPLRREPVSQNDPGRRADREQ